MHKRLIHQKVGKLPGDRLHCFHQNVMNRETKCGVLCSETPICRISSGTLLEGNKDHLPSQARSDLAKQELNVESLKKCIGDLRKRTESAKLGTTGRTRRICRISSRTNSIARGIVTKGKSSSRYADSKEARNGKMKRVQVQQVDEFSMQKLRENHETIQQLTLNCSKCKNR